MTYSEYRHLFITTEEFMQAFGKLSEEEASELIDAENAPIHVKACMITTWRKAKAQYGETVLKLSEEVCCREYIDSKSRG